MKRLLIPLTATALSAAALAVPASAAPAWASDPLAAKPADGYSNAYFWLSSNGAALRKATQYHWDAKAVSKLKIAKAADQPDDGKPGSTAPITKAPAGAKVKNINLPRTIGKVFFVDNKGEHHWCSATSIQSRHRNLVATAGHCVFENGKDDVYDKWVFVPGSYQGKAPYGIYAGAYAFTSYDLDTYDDYDGDFAFVAVHHGFQFAGTKEVSKADYDKWTGDKWVRAREITREEFAKCRQNLGKCWSQGRTESELAGPDFPGAVVERVEVSADAYKSAKVGQGQGHKFGEPTVEHVTRSQWNAYKGLGTKSKDKAGNYLITHYYTQKWVKPGTARKYFTIAYTVGVGKDLGPLGDAVGGQGIAWNQPLGQKVTVFGYPGEPHPDGHKAFTGVTPKWCYGKTGTKTYQANTFRVETHQVLKCSMTGGADGGPWLLRYDNGKRTGYVNGVTSMFHDQDGNDRVDTISSPYFDGEVADVYNKANYAETKPVVGPNGELLK